MADPQTPRFTPRGSKNAVEEGLAFQPKFDADGTQFDQQIEPGAVIFNGDAPFFTKATLAIIPDAQWSTSGGPLVVATEIECHDVALPISMVLARCAAHPDFDRDGDVDGVDYGIWRSCATGPETTVSGIACLPSDFDCDNHVDLKDFAIFQRQVTRPAQP